MCVHKHSFIFGNRCQLTLISDGDIAIIPRDRYLNRLVVRKHNGMAKVVTGVRRCGKSYLLFNLFREHLLQSGVDDDHIIAIALDSIENREYRDVNRLHERIASMRTDGSMHYVLLDEIQLADGFEEMVNSLIREDDLDVYVTGSNSKFLSSDIITEFRGRGDEINIRPLSFSEFCSVYNGDRSEALAEYMDYGGLPALVKLETDEQKASYLASIMKTVYLKDIEERNGIERPYLLDNIVDVLSSTACSLVNPTKIKDTLASQGYRTASEDTIVRYIGYLEDAFLFEKAGRYDIKGRKRIGALAKYYPVDHGISNARVNFRQTSDRPHVMENIIYNELRSRGYVVDVGVVRFRRSIDGRMSQISAEVDFVARKGSRTTYIQSAYRIDDQEKREQELRPLMKIGDSFRKVVITGDSMKPNMDGNGILFIGLLQFLLDENSLDARRKRQSYYPIRTLTRGSHERDMDGEVQAEDARRRCRAEACHRQAEGLRGIEEHAPSALHRTGGNREDHLRAGPHEGDVRRELAGELHRAQRLRREGDRRRPREDKGVREDVPRGRRGVQDHIHGRGGRPDIGCPGGAQTHDGEVLGDLQVHPVMQLFLEDHRSHPIEMRGVQVQAPVRSGDPRLPL